MTNDPERFDVVDAAEKLDRILEGFDVSPGDRYIVGLCIAAAHIANAELPMAALAGAHDLLDKFTHEFNKHTRRRMH